MSSRSRLIASAASVRTALLSLAVASFLHASAAAEQLTLFAAVSTTNAMTEIGKLYEEKGLGKVRNSFGATSTLAKQIENGAPADIFLSADEPWMDHLMERGLIKVETRRSVISNTLALIARESSEFNVKIAPSFPLTEALQGKRLAVGDPDHTAVGIYAKEALTNLGVWDAVAPMLARAGSVRAGLAMVERGEVAAGIVFGTEANISDKVRIVDIFPSDSHAPITYPIALLTKGKASGAQEFLDFLSTPEAVAIFEKYGFKTLPN